MRVYVRILRLQDRKFRVYCTHEADRQRYVLSGGGGGIVGGAVIAQHNFFHPFVMIGLWFMIIMTVLVWRTKGDLPAFIDAINHLGDQWMAIIVISVGCLMLVMCKEFGLDSTIAGGIIGVGSNMLQNRIKDQANSQNTTQITTTSSTVPLIPKA